MKYYLNIFALSLFLLTISNSISLGQGVDLGLEVGINLDGPEYLWGGTATKEHEVAGQQILFGFGLDCYLVENARFLFTDLTGSYQFKSNSTIKPYLGGGLFFTRWSYKDNYDIDDFDTIYEKAVPKLAAGSIAEAQLIESSSITNSGILAKAGATFRPRSRFIPFAEALFLFDGSQLVIKSGFRVNFGGDS